MQQQQQQQGQQQQQQGMQLQLFDDAHSEYCAKVKVVLYCKRLSWTTLPAKPCGSAGGSSIQVSGFAARAPLGKIPALVVVTPDGEVTLCESEVINEWLEEQWPQPPMLPACPLQRAHARLLSRFHDIYLEPALRLLYGHVSPASRNDADVAAAAEAFVALLRQLEALLRCDADGRGDVGGPAVPPAARPPPPPPPPPQQQQQQQQQDGSGGQQQQAQDGGGGQKQTQQQAQQGGQPPPPQAGGRVFAAGTPFLTLADAGFPGALLYAEKLWPALGLGELSYEGLGLRRLAALRAALWAHDAVAAVLDELEPAAQAWVDGKLSQS